MVISREVQAVMVSFSNSLHCYKLSVGCVDHVSTRVYLIP